MEVYERKQNETCLSWVKRNVNQPVLVRFKNWLESVVFNDCKCGTCDEAIELLKSYDNSFALGFHIVDQNTPYVVKLMELMEGRFTENQAHYCIDCLFLSNKCRTNIAHIILPILQVDALNVFGRSVLDYMNKDGRQEEAHLLIQYGAKPSNIQMPPHVLSTPRWALGFVDKQKAYKEASRAILKLRKQRAKVIGQNNRDVLGIIARFVWKGNVKKN